MIEKIGIIGAGQMGTGIALVCAQSGYEVRLLDLTNETLGHSHDRIVSSLERRVAKGQVKVEDMAATLARIDSGTDYDIFGNCDLVIEAVVENEAVKRDVLKKLCANLKPSALIATNSSSISITRLAAVTDRPQKFVGLHFMNPVPVMQLVEVIRGIATDEDTFTLARDVVAKMGKVAAVAEDFPAFIVNRILLPMINEAIYTLYEGVGTVSSIDIALRLGAHHPMGPMQLADFIGLDTVLSVMQVLYEGLSDSKYRPCPLLVKYVEAGWLGQKTGRGFYDYSQNPPVPTR
ncbi:MAG: 3-hydroxybutyryl-CoA dehydrogenase [Rhodospirillaceae bacterium]